MIHCSWTLLSFYCVHSGMILQASKDHKSLTGGLARKEYFSNVVRIGKTFSTLPIYSQRRYCPRSIVPAAGVIRLGPTITVTYLDPSLINTSQTKTLLIAEYLVISNLQGFLEIDIGKPARVVRVTNGVNLEFGNSLFHFIEASSPRRLNRPKRPETLII